MTPPRRYRLRLYVAAVRTILRILDRLDRWHFDRHQRRLDIFGPGS